MTTEQTPAALAAEIKLLAEDMADAACATEAGDHVDRQRRPLHAAIDRLEALASMEVPDIRKEDLVQYWADLDGAIAWHLVERHAENWSEIGYMMDQWLAAKIAASASAAQGEPVGWFQEDSATGSERKHYSQVGKQYEGTPDTFQLYARPVAAAEQPANHPAIPEGWKLVPVEPTREMFDAAAVRLVRDDGDIMLARGQAIDCYTEMVNAAPPAPCPDIKGFVSGGGLDAAMAKGRDLWSARREVGKWLNERPNRELDHSDVGQLCADFDTLHAIAGSTHESEEPTQAEQVCGEAYQVVGSMLSDLGQFNTERATKILDNLSQHRMVHDDVLPWPSFERKPLTEQQITDLYREWDDMSGAAQLADFVRLVERSHGIGEKP